MSDDEDNTKTNFVENKSVLSIQISNLENDKSFYFKRCRKLEDRLQVYIKQNTELNTDLRIEKLKTYLLCKLTHFDIDEIWKECPDGIHIYDKCNECDENIPLYIHNYITNVIETKYDFSLKKKKIQTERKQQHFRKVKNQDFTNEDPEEQEEKIKKMEDVLEETIRENDLDVCVKDTLKKIEELFVEVSKSRINTKFLKLIKDYRNKLIAKYNLDEYIKLTKDHIDILEGIFSKKDFDKKKIIQFISKSLSPLEHRLLFYGKYYDVKLELEELQKLKISLYVNSEHAKRYVSFIQHDFCYKLCNYTISLFSIKDSLQRVLVNPYSFSNVVYLELEKSLKTDPYSFYILDKIDDQGKRFWKMNCRLSEFSKSISIPLKTYCIDLFRKLYFSVFNDNVYREDYKDKSIIMKEDCEQLLINIILLSNENMFCNTLRKLVTKFCTIHPTNLDKFDFTSDDKIIKNNFIQENDTKKESIKRMFDEITDENILKLFEQII